MDELPETKAEARAARERAVAAGEHTYIGHPCVKCGNRLRYVKFWRCERCSAKRGRRYALAQNKARAKGRPAGEVRYIGHPCRQCGGVERYINGGACCACVKSSNAKRVAQMKTPDTAATVGRQSHTIGNCEQHEQSTQTS